MTKRNKTILLIILGLSVILRIAAAFYLGDRVINLPGTADQVSYHTLANRLVSGYGLTFGKAWWPLTAANAPTAHWSYLYTFYLAILYKMFGAQVMLPRLVQVLLVGVLHPYLAFLIGRRLFEATIGLVAAAVTAGYAYFVYYAANLLTEPFYITAILGSLYLAIRLVDREKAHPEAKIDWVGGITFGLVLAAAVLLRQLFLLIIPFLFLWVWWSGGKRMILPLVTAGLLVVAVILPFTAYNYGRFDRFVLLNTNAGFAFYWGNHPIYGTQFIPILPPEMGSYRDLVPVELRSLDEAALDSALLKLAFQNIAADPARYLQLSLSRVPIYFTFLPSEESGTASNLARMLSFGILWPFMLLGLGAAVIRRGSLWQQLKSPIGLLTIFMLVYTGIHILTWTLIRYRLPVDAVLVIFAAYAFVWLAEKVIALARGEKEQSSAREGRPSEGGAR